MYSWILFIKNIDFSQLKDERERERNIETKRGKEGENIKQQQFVFYVTESTKESGGGK